MIGKTLSVYRITAPLGEGGMGVVWQALDTSLGRSVAIKVLPDLFAADPERLARFEREARLLASLSHPHVATVYGLHEADGVRFLAMELVAGEDLSQRLARGPLGIGETLEIGRQIAEALEAAHEHGIVHRDLKPANVKLTADGQVKVLDFGLAKALEPAATSATELAHSPTLTAMATQRGMVLGTAAYMSPEQARGKPVDRRADIWAFGVLLYEMLTGRRLFEGETVTDTLAAVLRLEPDWGRLPAETPDGLRRLLRRCLERDPKNRLHDIADARIALAELQRESAAAPESAVAARAVAATRSRRRPALAFAAAGLAAGILIGALAATWLGRDRDPWAEREAPLFLHLAPPAGVESMTNPAFAPDGSFVVYRGVDSTGQSRLYLQRFDEFEARPLAGTEEAQLPFVSFDGRWVGFGRGRSYYKVAVGGGEALRIGPRPTSGPGAAWGPDGTLVYAPSWLGGLMWVGPEGGEPRPLTKLDPARGDKGHWFPSFLPDGRGLLLTVWPAAASGINDARIGILDLKSGVVRDLLPGAQAFYVPSGHLVFYRAGLYHAVSFDLASRRLGGEAFPIAEGARQLDPLGNIDLSLAVSAAGDLAYVPGQYVPEATFSWLHPDGRLEPLPLPARPYHDFALAPDGRRLAFSLLAGGAYELRVADLVRGAEERAAIGNSWEPVWHPDERHLAFASMESGTFEVRWIDLAAGTPPEPLLATDQDEEPLAFTPDGAYVLVDQSLPSGHYRLRVFSVPPAIEPEVEFPLSASFASVSPDGRWLALEGGASVESGEGISVYPLRRSGARVRVGPDGGISPAFSPQGEWLFYAVREEIRSARYREEAGRFVIAEERVHARLPTRQPVRFAAARDGRLLVRLQTPQPPPHLRVVLGWHRALAGTQREGAR